MKIILPKDIKGFTHWWDLNKAVYLKIGITEDVAKQIFNSVADLIQDNFIRCKVIG
jgi:hypothetical protein